MSTAERNASVGRYGEQVALTRLLAEGMALVDRNWRCPAGELDLVLREVEGDREVLVFCEVKTRSSAAYGHPLEAVRPDKAARLRRLAALWVEEHGVRHTGLRIDLVGVLLSPSGAAEVEHLRGVG